MQNESITIGKHVLDYDGTRHYLITHSFIGWVAVTKVREKYSIQKNLTSASWLKRITTDHWDLFTKALPNQEMTAGLLWLMQDTVEKQLMPEIAKLAKALSLDEKLLRIFVLYDNVPYKINGPKLVHHASPLNPITEPGTYLKIDENTTIADAKKEIAKIKEWEQIEAKVAEEQGRVTSTQIVKLRRKQIEEGDGSAVQVYLAVEKEIIELYEQRQDKNDLIPDEGYGNTLVNPAFERVAGNLLDEDDDEEFDRLLPAKTAEVSSIYYAVVRRFSLPTPKDKNRILKLINS